MASSPKEAVEAQGDRRAAQTADDSYMHLQVRLHYEDYERLKRLLKQDLKMSAQAFLIEAISAKLQALGHSPVRDPGTARPKKGA